MSGVFSSRWTYRRRRADTVCYMWFDEVIYSRIFSSCWPSADAVLYLCFRVWRVCLCFTCLHREHAAPRLRSTPSPVIHRRSRPPPLSGGRGPAGSLAAWLAAGRRARGGPSGCWSPCSSPRPSCAAPGGFWAGGGRQTCRQ